MGENFKLQLRLFIHINEILPNTTFWKRCPGIYRINLIQRLGIYVHKIAGTRFLCNFFDVDKRIEFCEASKT
jgi:hypothetical protein